MLNIRCWLFADLNIRSHHSQLTFSPSLSHLSVRSCASISFILILCAFLFNDDYSLDISAMCIYSSSSSLLFAVVVVYKFVVLSSLLFRLNCMRVFAAQMWMHFYISNWAYQPTDRKKKNTNILWTQLRECEAGKKCSKANTKWNSTSKLRAIAASFRCFILIAIRSAPIRINITANCNPGFRLRLKSHWHHFFRLFESGGSHLSWNDSEISRNRILGRSKLIL